MDIGDTDSRIRVTLIAHLESLGVLLISLFELAHIRQDASLHAVELRWQTVIPLFDVGFLGCVNVVNRALHVTTPIGQVSQLHVGISVAWHLLDNTL